jgi:hypothetical protein
MNLFVTFGDGGNEGLLHVLVLVRRVAGRRIRKPEARGIEDDQSARYCVGHCAAALNSDFRRRKTRDQIIRALHSS